MASASRKIDLHTGFYQEVQGGSQDTLSFLNQSSKMC